MEKPQIFIGSSSESLAVAEVVRDQLSPELQVNLWSDSVFALSRFSLDSLLKACKQNHFAVFILAEDDLSLIRKELKFTARDNVIFELGMFVSMLGYERCFILLPALKDFQVPSDLSGITYATYQPSENLLALSTSVVAACDKIKKAIGENRNDLSGNWLMFRDTNLTQVPNGEMLIACNGSKASAHMTLFNSSKDGEDRGRIISARTFKYDGRFLAGQFAFSFEQESASDRIIGTMVLRASSDNVRMTGQSSFWHHDNSQMETKLFELRRNPKGVARRSM